MVQVSCSSNCSETLLVLFVASGTDGAETPEEVVASGTDEAETPEEVVASGTDGAETPEEVVASGTDEAETPVEVAVSVDKGGSESTCATASSGSFSVEVVCSCWND